MTTILVLSLGGAFVLVTLLAGLWLSTEPAGPEYNPWDAE